MRLATWAPSVGWEKLAGAVILAGSTPVAGTMTANFGKSNRPMHESDVLLKVGQVFGRMETLETQLKTLEDRVNEFMVKYGDQSAQIAEDVGELRGCIKVIHESLQGLMQSARQAGIHIDQSKRTTVSGQDNQVEPVTITGDGNAVDQSERFNGPQQTGGAVKGDSSKKTIHQVNKPGWLERIITWLKR